MVEKDHLGDWSPEKDCCLQLEALLFATDVSSDLTLKMASRRLLKCHLHTTALLRSLIRQIFFNQGMK